MTQSINEFGFEAFHKVSKLKEGTSAMPANLFISPSSLAIAIAMTAGGAEGDTVDAMLSTLGLNGVGKADAAQYFKALVSKLEKADDQCSLEIANSIWIHNTLSVKDSFIKECREQFDATASTRDFDSKSTLDEINAWCADKTNGKIPFIIDKLSSSLVMALLNALYFKGPWAFEWSRAKDAAFHSIDSVDRPVSMMRATEYMNFAENDLFEVLELPYGNGSFVLDILLPKNAEGFADAAASLDGESWSSLCNSFVDEEVSFTIPKFKIEDDIDMTDILKNMGMAVAFGDYADFRSISDTTLQIGLVKQKTFVDVNEKGTEAAAVTLIGVRVMSLPPSEKMPRKFVADRPFVFIIRERFSGIVLFIGEKTI